MGYQDYDRFGRERSYGGYRPSGERGEGRRDRERSWRDEDRYDRDRDDDRGFFERAGDEVRSWFGDEEAERRRRQDERDYERERGYEQNRGGYASRERRQRDDDRWIGSPSAGAAYRPGRFFSGDAAGDYGAGRGAGSTGSWGLGAGKDRETWGHDPYRSWRDRQMREYDRDYDEYQREHQSKFEHEFGSWRENRQKQRQSLGQVRVHQDVVGSDGQPVGTVDKIAGDRIVLAKGDAEAGGHHHSIPCSWVTSVGERVEINKTAEEAHRIWRDEENRSAFLGEEDRERDQGPHYLNRSFSGTYER